MQVLVPATICVALMIGVGAAAVLQQLSEVSYKLNLRSSIDALVHSQPCVTRFDFVGRVGQ